MTNGHPLIQVKNLDLYFGAFHALKNVSVDFHAGELVGLVGDNGAGKTTLIRVLCGMHTPTSGEVYFDGQRVEKFHPKLAIDQGIETIQQSVGLCDNLSIARNFYLGREPVRRILGIPFLDFTTMRDKSTRVIRQFGLRDNVSADDEVERLSGGERQSVKIGRAVEFRNRVVIMDEPTNHLSVREREHVNELAVQLKKQGLLVIYITHDIFQVHKLADRIVIMENGEKIEDASTSKMTAEQLEEVIRQGGRVVERREALS
ncbi:ATP-binding cassette domain-containing protein [Mesorhizobium wenxiniae]|jgi:simple sugar transport system ATP-binding protein|uniref:Ribonucleotide-diphosphate reductase subunit alpha n=1 Tax=Mesorhizobium wenxiniae TaxID=2014805 RepID=A0A271KAY6_9HYPH|nr:ATP-binding cassette domain-containing protein [Mesorhizobium wenxiniae]PAP92933.1 ribonucleotide-diphosphate reductase subunit alpha [Mesorhizobium wenxiniae]